MMVHLASEYAEEDVAGVVEELVNNQTLVVLIAARFLANHEVVSVRRSELALPSEGMFNLSTALMTHGLARVRQPAGGAATQLAFSCGLASRLSAHKLVVVDPRGGLRGTTGIRSFLNAATLTRLSNGQRGGTGWRRAELETLRVTVAGGVHAINLTSADTLAAELFTYEGAGTLLTARDYCHIGPLGLDDFPQALSLLDRGEREGFLVHRSPEQRSRLLLSAFGAWFEGHYLAGIAALETDAYKRHKLGEIVGLYTITRFKGEGVGVRIVEALAEAAVGRGCRALFACTAHARAGEFFERNGFRRVAADAVPRSKWEHRAPPLPDVFWRDL